MSKRTQQLAFATLLFVVGLILLASVSWKVALGVFLFGWGNNLALSMSERG